MVPQVRPEQEGAARGKEQGMADHPNAERLRKGYDAFARGDLDALRNEFFAPDIVFHIGGNNRLTGTYKGVDEVFRFFGELMEASGGTFKLEIHDVVANDEHAVGLVRNSAERDGKRLNQNVAHVFHFNSEGKVTENWTLSENTQVADEFFG
jgi:ketosteroid isomerase-like protein